MAKARKADLVEKKSGAQTRIRTTDTRIFNPLLYQLSYLGIAPAAGAVRRRRRGL